MSEHVTSTTNEIVQAVNIKVGTAVTNSTVATGLVVTGGKPEIAGSYLTTHFFGPLSYLECIQVVGAVWIVYQIVTLACRQISSIYRSFKNGQQTGQ